MGVVAFSIKGEGLITLPSLHRTKTVHNSNLCWQWILRDLGPYGSLGCIPLIPGIPAAPHGNANLKNVWLQGPFCKESSTFQAPILPHLSLPCRQMGEICSGNLAVHLIISRGSKFGGKTSRVCRLFELQQLRR